MEIRAARKDDSGRIHDLHSRSVRELWPGHYTAAQIEGWIAGRTPEGYLPAVLLGEIFVAERGSRLVGFGHARRGSVEAIFVEPEAAGTGVGRALVQRAVLEARRGHAGPIRLTATLNAVGFYERLGFVQVERKVVRKGDIALPVVVMQLPGESD
jgi:GNAT superfamily N-acetyltransferase